MRTIVLQLHYKNIELTQECRLTLIDSKIGVQSYGTR
ncbi:hypothetical protein D8834_05785 [Streptococcus oralis]|nr:hypothetical protein D8834_05785 [Streptococcus oralis]